MTISSQIRKAGPYVGNGSASAFPFAFKVFTASDLYVVKTNTTLGADSVLTLGADYTVSLNADQNANPGGTITLTAGALASGYNVTITSSLQYLQPTDLTNQGGFYPSVITNALDRLTIFCQQLFDAVSRSLKVSVSTPSGVSTTLPPPAANKLIAWNSTADNLQNMDPTALATIVAFGTANADKFSGDGSTTQFALSANPGALNNLDVAIGGVSQRPGIDYTWNAGTTITFTSAPPVGTNNVLVRYMQGLPQGYTTADLVQFTPAGTGAVPTSAQVKMRERVSVKDFGVVGDGSDEYAKIALAWAYCLANGKDLYFPAGTYSSGVNNMPFKNPSYPATSLLDCKNITICGDGPNTILRSDSAVGADVLNLYSVKNLHVRDVKVTASLSGTSGAGSNGISIVGGFDNLTFDRIWCENLPYVDKASYLDGGKAFTIQPGTPATECGTLKAKNIFAKGCVYGAGLEVDLVNFAAKKHAIDIEIVAEDCYQGVIFSAAGASGALSTAMTMGFKVRAKLVNCQHSVVIGRAHGVDIEANIITTKSAAARRLNPSSGTWNSIDSIVDGLVSTYAKNSRIVVYGDLGGCDYKAQIGGTSQGSSGLSGATEWCDIYLDLGGTASIAAINAVDYGGNTLASSILTITTATASSIPSDFAAVAKNNTLNVVGAYGQSVIPGNVRFPATQIASSDANTLDDYEEGTWTPTFGVSGGVTGATFTVTEARYTKVGRLVNAMFTASRNDASALSGAVTWSLPFASDGTANWYPCGMYSLNGVNNGGLVLIDNYANNVANGLNIAAGADLSYAVLANTYRLNVSMTYMTAT